MKKWTSSGRWIVNVCKNRFGFREKKLYICSTKVGNAQDMGIPYCFLGVFG